MATPNRVADQKIATTPNRRRDVLRRGLPILAIVALTAACSSSEETMGGSSTEPVPATGSTPTGESTSTTELTPITESIPTTDLESTTSINVDPGEVASCRNDRDNYIT